MKQFAVILISFYSCFCLYAAELPRLKIILQDSVTHQAVPYASLSLRSHQDSLLLAGRADQQGSYAFHKLNEGMYRLKVSAVGYTVLDTLLQVDALTGQTYCLNLRPTAQKLKEVMVTGTRKAYEQKYDRKVYTMTEAQKATARTVLDLLKTLPGVIVHDEDKSIIYRGSTPEMQVNDLPSGFMYPDLSVIPAEKVNKIELIDASSRGGGLLGGIINILLVKPNKEGLDGVLSSELKQSEISHSFGQEHLLSLNYGVGKNILFGNFAYKDINTHNLNYKSGYSLNSISGKEAILESDSTKNGSRFINGIVGNLRLVDSLRTDYYGLAMVGAFDNSSANNYALRGNMDYYLTRTGTNDSYAIGFCYGIIKKFTKVDKQLIIYSQFSPEISKANGSSNYTYKDGTNLNVSGQSPSNKNYFDFNIYYNNPLKKGWNFSFSQRNVLLGSYSKSNRWKNQLVDTLNLAQNRCLTWEDRLNINIGRMVKKIRFEAGLAFKHNYNIKNYKRFIVVSNDTNFVLKKHYLALNPTANFTWHCSETNDFSVKYAYTMEFPEIDQLNSYVDKRGVYSWSTGNPDLRSAQYHNFSLGHTYSREKYNFSTDLVYKQSNNEIVTIGYFLPNNIKLLKPVNIGSSQELGVVFTNWTQLSSKFSMTNSATLNYKKLDQSNLKKETAAFGLDGEKFVFTQFNYDLNTYITCKINDKNYASLRANYYSKSLQFYGYRKPWISSSFNYTRKFLKDDRLKMILSIDNFTYGLIDRVAVNNNMGTYTTSYEDPSNNRRTYKISFTYIFNNGDKRTRDLPF